MKKSFFAAFILGVVAFGSAYADNTIPKAEREKVAQAVNSIFGGTGVHADAIRKTSMVGIYEARLPSGPVFVSKDASWVMQGNLFDVAKRENLRDTAIIAMQKVAFSDIPLDNAIKFVRGNGSRKLITFEDANCGYCKKFAAELERLDNATVYVFPVAMIAPTSNEKANNVLCADIPTAAWRALMLESKDAIACKSKAKSEVTAKKQQAIQRLVEKHFITGTPTLFFENDTRVNGYIAVGDLENRLNDAAKSKN